MKNIAQNPEFQTFWEVLRELSEGHFDGMLGNRNFFYNQHLYNNA